jgi:hypothetical protein
MARLSVSEVSSPADLGLAVYSHVQEITQGKAHRAASFLSEIACLELEGRELTASPWCVLVLFSLSDLAIHAPGETLEICNWTFHYQNMAMRSGEESAREVASALIWAGCTRRNVELSHSEVEFAKNKRANATSGNVQMSESTSQPADDIAIIQNITANPTKCGRVSKCEPIFAAHLSDRATLDGGQRTQ